MAVNPWLPLSIPVFAAVAATVGVTGERVQWTSLKLVQLVILHRRGKIFPVRQESYFPRPDPLVLSGCDPNLAVF